MKIVTNLIPDRHDTAWMAAIGLSAGALLLLVLTTWMVMAIVELRTHEADLRTRVASLKSRDFGDAATRAAAVHDMSAVRERVQRLNLLIGHSGQTSPSLLETLERLLPGPAHLLSLQHRVRTGDVTLIVAAAGTAPLTAFLRALEREPRFQQVLLLHQASAANGGLVQFEIRLKERT